MANSVDRLEQMAGGGTMASKMADKMKSPPEQTMGEDEPMEDDDEGGGEGEAMTFMVPRGVQKWEDAEEGETVKLMVEVRKEDAQKACVLKVDGKMTPYAEKDSMDEGDDMNEKPGKAFLAAIDKSDVGGKMMEGGE